MLTLLVLSKCDVILISRVHYPEDSIQVGCCEQIWCCCTTLLRSLQLLQLLDEKLSGILWWKRSITNIYTVHNDDYLHCLRSILHYFAH